jgi:sporulation protein YlmC with PRC-barrel domain
MPDATDADHASADLIAASRIKGSSVVNRAGETLGAIDDLMLDRTTGQAAFAILRFGGFLGFGNKHHPLPWASLTYDAAHGAYVVDLERAELEHAPAYDPEDISAWEDPTYGRQVSDYYGRPKV